MDSVSHRDSMVRFFQNSGLQSVGTVMPVKKKPIIITVLSNQVSTSHDLKIIIFVNGTNTVSYKTRRARMQSSIKGNLVKYIIP